MSECEQICYQQWVDMYNKKDKECFSLQLKLSRIEDLINIIINTNCNCISEVQNIPKIIRAKNDK